MRLSVGAADLDVAVVGEGPTLVLLHAFPFDRRMWDEERGRLSDRYRVITLSYRGCGASSQSVSAFSVDDLADDVVAVLDTLGVPMAAVAGLSLGGYVALALAARHPARLWALGLFCTRATGDDDGAKQARQRSIARVAAGEADLFVDELVGRLLSPSATPAQLAHARGLGERRPRTLISLLEVLRDRPDRTALLPQIRVPALVLSGAADQVVPGVEAERMAESIPGARHLRLAGAGHLCHLEQPEAFAQMLGDFLDQATPD